MDTPYYPDHGARGICRCDEDARYFRPNGPGPGKWHHRDGKPCPKQPSQSDH